MKKLFKIAQAQLLSVVFPAKNDLKKIEGDLNSLQKEMQEISKIDNKVEAIIRLFKVVSPIQDKGGFSQTICKLHEKNYGQLDQIISALEVLQIHFRRAGRNEYGINRTKVGEEVTSENVFLGNVFGLWTKTASYWLENQQECKKMFRGDVLLKDHNNPVSTWDIINEYQAGAFVKSHTRGILEQIAILKKVA